jgi:8-oxo-dGTP pyrophosphatase MutT (NUDIX family)
LERVNKGFLAQKIKMQKGKFNKMIREKSAGAIIFRRENGKIKYLILRRNPKYWDLPKGNIEKDEKEEETVKREVREETGIKEVKIIPEFKEKEHYFYRLKGELVSKDVVFFLAESSTDEVKISKEHEEYEWLPFDEAIKKVKSKGILEKADKFLNKNLTKFFE